MSQEYQVFYNIMSLGEEVPSDAPVVMTLEEVCSRLFPALQEHDDFLGIVDRKGGCFQIRVYGGYLLDVPILEREGSLQLTVDSAEALERLTNVPQEIVPEAFPDFAFELWRPPEEPSKPWWRFW